MPAPTSPSVRVLLPAAVLLLLSMAASASAGCTSRFAADQVDNVVGLGGDGNAAATDALDGQLHFADSATSTLTSFADPLVQRERAAANEVLAAAGDPQTLPQGAAAAAQKALPEDTVVPVDDAVALLPGEGALVSGAASDFSDAAARHGAEGAGAAAAWVACAL